MSDIMTADKHTSESARPMVSVMCMAYNHEGVIRRCLEGIVSQKTDFPFEAVIHDDCSTDGTRAIIEEYAAKYPDIIKPIYETENQYSKFDGSLRRAIFPHLVGKYVAICEGDDYWTSPDKLQMQVDFLESHPDYALCFHKVEVVDESGLYVKSDLYKDLEERDYTADEIIRNWIVPTCSAVMIREGIVDRPYDKGFIAGDNVTWMQCCSIGKARCLDASMGVYRRMANGATTRIYSPEKILKTLYGQIRHLNLLEHYYPGLATRGINEKKKHVRCRILLIEAGRRKPQCLSTMREGVRENGLSFVSALIGEILWRIKIRLKK